MQTLRQQQAPLTKHIQEVARERDDSTKQLDDLRSDNERLNRNTVELLRLRGEVGVLRRQTSDLALRENRIRGSESVAESQTNQSTPNAFAPYGIAELSPARMERNGLSFSVQPTTLADATRFTVSISCDTKRRVSLPRAYYATLKTEAEGPVNESETINGRPVVTRLKTGKEKGEEIGPALTNQADRIVYSFEVPTERQADAAFMFWVRNPPGPNTLPEGCYRIALKPFAAKREER